jgi:DNA repair exonuclease SbcCD ATPase subunit
MKFLDLHIDQFLTISVARVNLADRGLNLIQGVNADDDSASSNGAGKSSIVDALCWCVYGLTARGLKGDQVVNRIAKKNTAVSVRLQNGASIYKVTRYRKHQDGKNTLNLWLETPGGAPVVMTRGTDAETQKEVEKVLGCSHEVFIASIYSGQEAMPDLPRMGDRDLKRLIEEAAGLQRIERAYGVARERLNTAKSALADRSARLDNIKTTALRTESGLQMRRDKALQWDAGRTAVLAGLEARVAAAKTDTTTKALAAQKFKPAADAATARLAEIGVTLAAHATAQKLAQNAGHALNKAEQAIEKHALQSAGEKVQQLAAQLANAEAEVSRPCTECGTPGSLAKLDEWVGHKTLHLEKARAALEAVKGRVRAQIAERDRIKADYEKSLAEVPDVSALNAERDELERVKKLFQDALRAAQTAKTTLDQERLSFDNQKAAPNPEAAVVKTLEENLREETAQIAALQSEVEQAQEKVDIAEGVVKVFGPAGVRAQILDTVTPFLNERTADYLSVLSDGAMQAIWTTLTKSATGDLKEKFSIEVTHAKGGDSFAALSGGEKRKVRLATALALQDLVASRATQPIDLFIGDELDDALDPSGLERLMTILERKARERGTVIVISHSDIRDWCDQITTVTKSGGTSLVEGSLCV